MNSYSPIYLGFSALLFSLAPLSLHALPVDLSAPAGILGPTTAGGAAEHWLELGNIDFGGGLALPLRLSLNSARTGVLPEFGKGAAFWRAPELHARVLDGTGDRRGVLLPCGKVLFLQQQQADPERFATEDGEWQGVFNGRKLSLSREDGWQLDYNEGGWLARLRTDTGRVLFWNRAPDGGLLFIAEQAKPPANGPAAWSQGTIGLTVKRDKATGVVIGLEVRTAAGRKTYSLGYNGQQQLASVQFPSGQREAYAYDQDQEGNPSITITGRDLVSRTLRWSKADRTLLSDGVWSYKIETVPGATSPRMTRTGPGGEVESYFDDSKASGRTEFTSTDGTTVIRQKVVAGAARGKLASISRLYKGGKAPVVIYTASYDEQGLLAQETDAMGRSSAHSYTLWGRTPQTGVRIHVQTSPLGTRTSEEFDQAGNLVASTDAMGRISRNTYDDQHHCLSKTGPGGVVLETLQYDAAGRITARINAANARTTYGYDKEGNLTVTTDALGHVTRDEFDARGDRVKSTDALGRIWSYQYDQGGRLIRTVAPDGVETERRTYNAQGLLASTTDAAGNTATTLYDALGRIISQTDVAGRTKRYAYDASLGTNGCSPCTAANSKPTLIVSPSGRQIRRQYDADRHLTAETKAFGSPTPATTTYAYDAAGNLLKSTDALGRITQAEYDAGNRQTAKIHADGSRRTFQYDVQDHPLSETDELGGITRREYDAFGNLVKTIDAIGGVATISFATPAMAVLHQPTAFRTAAGLLSSTEYDALGRKTAQIIAPGTPEQAVTRHEFDAMGNEIRTSLPTGKTVTSTFDLRNRRTQSQDALGRIWKYGYNAQAGANGQVPCCGADPTGNSQAQTVTFPDGSQETRVTDAIGAVLQKIDAQGKITLYGHDEDGRINMLTDAGGNVTRWTHDAAGNLATKVYPDQSKEVFVHDAARQLISRTRPDGSTASYTFDVCGRLTSVRWAGGKSEPVDYTYDAAGRMLSAANTSARIERTYAANGSLISETQTIAPPDGQAKAAPAAYKVGYTFDADKRLSALDYPDATRIRYSYSSRDELAAITETLPGAGQDKPETVITYDHRPDRQAAETKYANGLTTRKTYDAAGRLTQILHVAPDGTVLEAEASRYDGRDRRLARVKGDGTADLYAYDPAGQIISAAYAQPEETARLNTSGRLPDEGIPWQQRFAYDAAGNRKEEVNREGPSTTYKANKANQYTSIQQTAKDAPAVQVKYDANGNLTEDGWNTYAWDAESRLTAVTTRDGAGGPPTTVRFRYDALNRRVARMEARGSITHFVHDEWNVIAEYDAATHASAAAQPPSLRLVWGEDLSTTPQGLGGIGGLVKTTRNGTATDYFSYDSNGNVILLTAQDASVTARYAYDAFGRTMSAKGENAATNLYRFSTKPVETQSGLCYYGLRYYSPAIGRWTSRDPMAEKGGINLYGMLQNDPINRVDIHGANGAVIGAACAIIGALFVAWQIGAELACMQQIADFTANCKNAEKASIEMCNLTNGDWTPGVPQSRTCRGYGSSGLPCGNGVCKDRDTGEQLFP